MKSQKLLESFTAYCTAHPELRFWQALRNWSGYDKVIGERSIGNPDLGAPTDKEDTFYIE